MEQYNKSDVFTAFVSAKEIRQRAKFIGFLQICISRLIQFDQIFIFYFGLVAIKKRRVFIAV